VNRQTDHTNVDPQLATTVVALVCMVVEAGLPDLLDNFDQHQLALLVRFGTDVTRAEARRRLADRQGADVH
jgi:hypothetical protein